LVLRYIFPLEAAAVAMIATANSESGQPLPIKNMNHVGQSVNRNGKKR
jgi:hypothetical protein